ncbi:MAG: polymer-forming cytoskeletal protein [Deltaproteobacteria bacterium]|jgi:cytoskeletal protein CcmA (bactofilin family)|nr:polymer-forming cytoskeletal protein [Deltaproteobacteria bacterium]
MLKRSKKDEKSKAAVRAGKAGAGTGISEEEKRLLVSGKASATEYTVIGEHITIEGSISGEENLVIDGAMKGNVELKNHNFTIGSKGRFDGEIEAKNVSISGDIKGKVKTPGRVQITREADFIGEIKAQNISVEDGAYFKGVIELQREPNRKTVKSTHADAKSASQMTRETDSQTEKEVKKGT